MHRISLALLVAALSLAACGGALSSLIPGMYEAGLDTHYQRTADPRKISVTAIIGRDDVIVDYSAVESADTVSITVRARNPNPTGASDDVGYSHPVDILLREPLVDRKVIDARTGARMQDAAVSAARREPGIVDVASYRVSAGAIELQWSDSKGMHRLSDLRGATVVLLSRGTTYEQASDSKLNMLAFEDLLAHATDAIRASTFVLVVNFDRANAFAPDDDPFRALFVDPATVPAAAPEILQPAARAAVWFVGPDGSLRSRLQGATDRTVIERELAAAR